MWKCLLVPVGLLLSWVEAGAYGGRGATAAQHTSRAFHGSPQAWGKEAKGGGGLSAGCQDGVHRALTYELTASALVSPLAANSIGHRYVRLNASRNDTKWGRGVEVKAQTPSIPLPPSYFHVCNPA